MMATAFVSQLAGVADYLALVVALLVVGWMGKLGFVGVKLCALYCVR